MNRERVGGKGEREEKREGKLQFHICKIDEKMLFKENKKGED